MCGQRTGLPTAQAVPPQLPGGPWNLPTGVQAGGKLLFTHQLAHSLEEVGAGPGITG